MTDFCRVVVVEPCRACGQSTRQEATTLDELLRIAREGVTCSGCRVEAREEATG